MLFKLLHRESGKSTEGRYIGDGRDKSAPTYVPIRSNYMQIVRWQEATLPQEQELRRRMQQQGLSPYSWSNGPGDTYAVHSHSYEKVLYCVRGSIRLYFQINPKPPEIST